MKTNDHPEPSHSFDVTYNENEEMFGRPYKELQDYFTKYSVKGTVLDLGCGQGRDALFLASLGYDVTAVDNSEVGISQMMEKSDRLGLKIHGIAADILDLKLEKKFDVILFDMVLHAFEEPQQLALLKMFAGCLKKGGVLCIVFPDDMTTEHFMRKLEFTPHTWQLKDEIVIEDVPKLEGEENDFTFTMIVIRQDNPS